MPLPLMTRRSVLLAALESTYDVYSTLSPSTDAFLATEPDYSLDMVRLERNFDTMSLTKTPGLSGRKVSKLTFKTELRGNNKISSGIAGDEPRIVRLFRACGYAATFRATATTAGPYEIGDHINPVSWVKAGTVADTSVMYIYHVEVVLAGASSVAKVKIVSPQTGESSVADITVTSGSPITCGTKGVTLTPTFTGNLALGQTWVFYRRPKGVELNPVSNNAESLSMRLYKDGVAHTLTGCRGTFVINAQSGGIPMVTWTFTGTYLTPSDIAIPNATYETTKPALFQKAQLSVDGFAATVDNFTFTQGNDVQVRVDANQNDGYSGVLIVDRTPTMGIDPEATLVADHSFWTKMSAAKIMPFTVQFGTANGNTINFLALSTQYTGMTYADRIKTVTYNAGLSVSGIYGDDECLFYFT